MTDETLADKRRRQAKEAERNGDLGMAWTCLDDANALDAKDARIAELERERDGWQGACEAFMREGQAVNWRIDAAEAKCERLRDALQEARDTLRDDRIGTTRMDDPNLYQRIWAAADKADATLTTDHEDDNTTA